MMSTLKSRIAIWKFGFLLFLLTLVGVISLQNTQPITIELLFWEMSLPVTILLFSTVLISALIVFMMVLIKTRS